MVQLYIHPNFPRGRRFLRWVALLRSLRRPARAPAQNDSLRGSRGPSGGLAGSWRGNREALQRGIRNRVNASLVFLEADDNTIVRRFSETRRPHPLGTDNSIAKSIKSERRQLAAIRRMADLVINTSKFTVHELREFVRERFRGERDETKMLVYVTSFGYRHGVPPDSDLVFDVRFLPNPNYIPSFKKLTGRHPSVAKYIRSFPQTVEFIDRIADLLVYLMPHYIREGKSYLTIAFGCTGGHHRSVMIADSIRKRLAEAGFRVKVTHRDMAKPV